MIFFSRYLFSCWYRIILIAWAQIVIYEWKINIRKGISVIIRTSNRPHMAYHGLTYKFTCLNILQICFTFEKNENNCWWMLLRLLLCFCRKINSFRSSHQTVFYKIGASFLRSCKVGDFQSLVTAAMSTILVQQGSWIHIWNLPMGKTMVS